MTIPLPPGPTRHRTLVARLRDNYTCRTGLGGCGALPGQPCLTRGGKPTQPHEARWAAERLRAARAASAPRVSLPPEAEDRHGEMLDLAAALLTEAQALLAQVAREQHDGITG